MKLKSLKGKILIGYLLVVLILVIVTLWSFNNFSILSDAINNIMVENYQSIKASENMVESIERQDSATLMLLNGPSEEARKTFRTNEQDFYKWLARAEDNITVEGEAEIINKISNNYVSYINQFNEFYHQPSGKQWDYYNSKILPLFDKLKNEIRNLRSINQNTMVNAQKKADIRAESAIISTGIISVLAIIIAIVFALYLSNLILKPVNELEAAIKSVAKRNFKQKIKVHSSDEIGKLATEFNKMIERLQEYEKININKLVAEKEKSEAIVNNISSPIIVTDNENKVVLMNEEAKMLFNIKEESPNSHFLEVINDENLFKIIKGEYETDNNIVIEKENKDLHFKVSSKCVSNNKGDKRFTVTLLEDITKLKEIDNMKSDFVSTVSHEFRTPLTSMNMGLSMVLEEDVGEINDDQRELLKAAYEDCERLNDLVNDLLDLSKIESGKIKMEFSKTNVKKLIEATIRPFQQQVKDKEVNLISEDIDDNISAWADSNKISWVISNLIGNALRYTPKDGTIKVGAKLQGKGINIFVEDTGIGIPEEYQDKIFEKFVRANNNDDSASGTGLGLAISKEIIEAHKGSIWVESKEGKGSKFVFYLPRYRHLTGGEKSNE